MDIADIVYHNTRHENKDGIVVQIKVEQGCFAAQMSLEIQSWIISFLFARVPPAKIMNMHMRRWRAKVQKDHSRP